MIETPYKVLGAGVATMLGRRGDLAKILTKLEREIPAHTSVVGAKYIGKTVFLHALAEHIRANESRFEICVYWDISRHTPVDDTDFFRSLANQLLLTEVVGKEYEEYFAAGTFEALREVFEDLRDRDKRILIIIDNLDKLLQIGHLSKDAWDNLRTLGELSSVCFVTGSRKRLRELIGSPEIQGSPFWNLFTDLLILGSLNDEDLSDFLASFGENHVTLEKGAISEIENYTNGIPILTSAFCLKLGEETSNGEVLNNFSITERAKGFVQEKLDMLKEIWNDCGEEQGIIEDLAFERINTANVPPRSLANLENNGIVSKKNGKVCRFIKEFLDYEQPQIKDLERLFGAEENFKKNLKKVLRLRWNQLQDVDETLLNYLRIAVENIDDPDVFCTQLRNLAKRAFQLIWKKDLPDGQIPPEWTLGWKQPDKKGNPPEYDPPEGAIPSGRRQLYPLNLMTDTRKVGSSHASRTSYFMLAYLYQIGDFGAHLDDHNIVDGKGYDVPEEFAYTVCLAAIELCFLLTDDLKK